MTGFFHPHIELAHRYWQECIRLGDSAIDATCGNGHDTLELCRLILKAETSQVYAYDIQEQALATTRKQLEENLSSLQLERVQLIKGCHSDFSKISHETSSPIRLVVYNLGYLPGGDKSQTTLVDTTLLSIQNACKLVSPGGLISITCYPGHTAGAVEEEAVCRFAEKLPRVNWSCCHHRWINRQRSPSLFLLQKM